MANVAFTRDEVILTLDVLYNSGTPRLNSTSEQIAELSALLQNCQFILTPFMANHLETRRE